MTRKKKIFIGSSSNELHLAHKAKKILEEEFNFQAIVWNDPLWETGTFRLNSNTLDSLLKATLSCDFGLMIGTKDDKVQVKGEEKLKARDNIIFELGLFMGRVGVTHSAFIVEDELDIMSDVDGICLAFFDKTRKKPFKKAVSRVGDYFSNATKTAVNFFPSATLAAVYYENFIRPTLNFLSDQNGFTFGEKSYPNYLIKIIVPNRLGRDLNRQFQKYKNEHQTEPVEFESPGRTRKLFVEADIKDDKLVFVDYPTVLTGINFALKNLIPADFNDTTDTYEDMLNRELERFIIVLKKMALHDDWDEIIEFERIN